jgi:hypothetical protein
MPYRPLGHEVRVSVARYGIWQPAGVYGTLTWAARGLGETASAARKYAAARARAATRGRSGLTGRDGH